MGDHTRDFVPAQHNAQSSGGQQRQLPAESLSRSNSFRSQILTMSDAPDQGEHPAFVSPNDLPPRYDLHQFPPTPPALHNSDSGLGSYFDQSFNVPPDQAPPVDTAWPPSEAPPRLFASRFPRWGTWLEKRALERHYAHLDAQAALPNPDLLNGQEAPSRKKSWGAWVNGPDAINDDTSASSSQQKVEARDAASLPPLHVHHFGSRFIPHLPAQPLCSILVDLPAPPHLHPSHNAPKRQVLLVGTAQGLFAIQLRDDAHSAFSNTRAQQSPTSPPPPLKQWNDNIRCVPIWTGLAIYQMCVLASNQDTNATNSLPSQSNDAPASGVFLALTCPSSAKDGLLSTSLMQLSAHAGAILESVASSGTFTSGASSSSHNSHNISDATEGVAAANFGSSAGGGPGRAVPPGGAGVVRMWHLQAIRELLTYALDRNDAQVPINLAAAPNNNGEKRGGLGNIFKKTFSKAKSKSEGNGVPRSASSASLSGTISPLTKPDNTQQSLASPQRSMPPPSSKTAADTRSWKPEDHDVQQSSAQPPSRQTLLRRDSPQKSPPTSRRAADPAHAAAISLAMSSVRIQPPSHTAAATQSNNPSLTSIFADDLIQSFTGNRQAGSKGKEREASLQAASKGVLFFSVHEAGADTKGAGTWYLAIAYARSVMVYEASMPRGGSSRAWSFVKELYAPFAIKAVAFAPAEVSDDLLPFANLGSVPANGSTTKLRVASAEGPLLTSKKGSFRDRGQPNGVARESGRSSPVRATRGSAAPASWHKADLCLLLSFGRRAVLVRLRDSHVRELDLKPLSQLMAAADGAEGAPTTQLSLQPQQHLSSADPQFYDRSRPLSQAGEGSSWADSQPPSAAGHSRAASVEQRFKDAILDKRSNKHNWVGFSSIEARILIRQWSESAANSQGDIVDGRPLRPESVGLSPMGLSLARAAPTASSPTLAGMDKDLPRVPAHQNASFDRRMSRLHLSEQTSQYHAELQAESSSDSDVDIDDDPLVDRRERAAKYQLTDPGPLPHGHQSTQTRTPNRSMSLPTAELVSAKLALASRGSVTHVMPLPLPADLTQAAPLAVMQWSDTPNSVSGWARVLGVERASSKGATPLSHLQSSSDNLASQAGYDVRRRNNRLVLHVGVTCVAFLASRIEARKVSFKIPVELSWNLSPDSELELIPLASGKEYTRANGVHVAPDSAIETPSHPSDADSSTSISDGDRATASERSSFAYPPLGHHPHHSSSLRTDESSSIACELPYLCAPLLTLHTIDLDSRSSGTQSLILPFSHRGEKGASAPHEMFPELAGDAGVVAFDWRGADDFRLFTVGIAG